ncbi:Glycoside hydrolase [Theobroma cacao]|nr:Glycoside hydrolase [Theobroma cacao]
MGQWLDYWLNNNAACEESQTWEAQNQNQNVFASNFVPLWIDLFNSDTPLVEKVTRSLQSSGLLCAAGIATSLTNSEINVLMLQRENKTCAHRDFPNGWASLQRMIVEGLSRSGSAEARSIAKDIAERWIRTMLPTRRQAQCMRNMMWKSVIGFGWSNGVVLAFLEEFGWPKDQKIDCN